MNLFFKASLNSIAALLVLSLALPAYAGPRDGGGNRGSRPKPASVERGGGGGGGARATTRSDNQGGARNTTQNNRTNNRTNIDNSSRSNTNIKNTNVNVNKNVNVNGNGGDWYDDDDWDVGRAMVTTAAVVGTAAVIGSIVHSVPPSCVPYVANGITYQQCGGTYYQPQYVGTQVQYVVVNAP